MMGGYAIHVKGTSDDGASSKQIHLGSNGFLQLATLQSLELPARVELMDKSKGDWISKSIISVQVIWFVSQLIGRATQKLPFTTLELFTCAIIVCTAITYVAWWNKPLEVQRPIVLGPDVSASFLSEHRILPLEAYQSIMEVDLPKNYRIGDPASAASGLLIVFGFAACHLIGWDFYFPTRIELLLWRVAGVLCFALPIAMGAFASYGTNFERGGWQDTLLANITLPIVVFYVLVRAYLLVEVFVGLRSVPADVYVSVNWSAYIPHI
jgi:hypothetical protein